MSSPPAPSMKSAPVLPVMVSAESLPITPSTLTIVSVPWLALMTWAPVFDKSTVTPSGDER